METPLTPIDFARRARKLYGSREAVVDGDLRLTYAQFGERCDRWSAALAKLGVQQGDRVGTIARNTHQHLEQFYAIPQLGAVIVPMNYRLAADDFVYLANHSGCKVLCVHSDYLELVDRVRTAMKSVEHFVALEGATCGLARLRNVARRKQQRISAAHDRRDGPARHQLHQRHHRHAEGRDDHAPERLGECGGDARALAHDSRGSVSLDVADVSCQRLDVHVDRHRGRGHACLPSQDGGECDLRAIQREEITALCAAPTVLIAIANGPEGQRRRLRRGVRLLTAGAPPAAATIERIEGELGWSVTPGLRPHRDRTFHFHLRAAARARGRAKAEQA